MKELDLTQGSVPKVLLQFAVPFLIANVLQHFMAGLTFSLSDNMMIRQVWQP